MCGNADLKTKPYLVCCGVFKDEIDQLSLAKDYNIVFLGMNLHLDYNLLKKTLTKVLEKLAKRSFKDIILVYGDYCLGPNMEMNTLAKKHNVFKVDALNCIDCFLGGGGSNLKVDPEDKMIFLSPSWIKFFTYHYKYASKDEQNFFRKMFSGFAGIVLLDTLGSLKDYEDQIQDFVNFSGLKVLETRKIGTDSLKQLIMKTK